MIRFCGCGIAMLALASCLTSASLPATSELASRVTASSFQLTLAIADAANGGGKEVSSIVYDGDGNRVSKTVNGTTTYYLVDDRNPTGYPQVLEERTSLASSENPTDPTVTYVYGLDLVSQKRGSSTHYFGYDGLGTVRYLTDTASPANVTDTYTYDAFGIEIASTGSTENNYRYTGEQWDDDLGLYYLRARYLNPATGRFWTMDTYEGNNSDPLSLHKYLYAHSAPVNRIDPSGLADYTLKLLYHGANLGDPQTYASLWYQVWDGMADHLPGEDRSIVVGPIWPEDNIYDRVKREVEVMNVVAETDRITEIMIVGHGKGGAIGTLDGGASDITYNSLTKEEMTPQKQLLDYLHPFTKNNCTVYLQACDQADPGVGRDMMERIAKLLEASVIGYDDTYAVWGWGNRWKVDRNGEWSMKEGRTYEGSWMHKLATGSYYKPMLIGPIGINWLP